ncbi:unnamed protein product [Effrenium voratum]|uniref:Pentatricopeptide repeat-containing protein, chloroplastic n=1 Tax=Effrenium voratum TaxID=2562239 RepID=A0AA36IHI6_9DINO|nr:unnamed protein product [Effrenium voratum]CAJ1431329.1 unnamed protein product [Effrenium voratum]
MAELDSLKLATRTIAQLGRSHRWQESLATLAATPRAFQNCILCNAAMNACAKSSNWHAALAILEDLQTQRVADVVSYSTAVSALERGNKWACALATLEEMRQAEVLPNTITCNAALSACEKSGKWQTALALLGRCRRLSVQADVVSFSAALSACEKGEAPWPMALQLLEAMTDQAVVPDVICLNAAISASHWPVALHLLRCMGQKRLRPTRTSYNAAISSCADGSEWQRALLLLARCRPDAVGFGSAMVALEREALWPLALHLLAASEKRSACDAVCFHNALTVCSAAKRWRECLGVLEQMGSRFGATLAACDQGLQSLEDWRQSLRLLSHMRQLKCPPDEVSYGLFFKALAMSGETFAAEMALKEMRAQTLQPNAHIYGSCMSMGNPEVWLRQMIAAQIELHTFAFTACIEAASPQHAHRLASEMQTRQLEPDLVALSLLSWSYTRARSGLRRAAEILGPLQRRAAAQLKP